MKYAWEKAVLNLHNQAFQSQKTTQKGKSKILNYVSVLWESCNSKTILSSKSDLSLMRFPLFKFVIFWDTVTSDSCFGYYSRVSCRGN